MWFKQVQRQVLQQADRATWTYSYKVDAAPSFKWLYCKKVPLLW